MGSDRGHGHGGGSISWYADVAVEHMANVIKERMNESLSQEAYQWADVENAIRRFGIGGRGSDAADDDFANVWRKAAVAANHTLLMADYATGRLI